MNKESLGWLEQSLWPRGQRRDIWMLLDAARDRRIFRMLLECGLQYSCLYSGYVPPALEIAAPYIVQLEYQDRYTRLILERGWGNSWGVLLKCDLSLAQVRRHLRHFLMARDPRGERLLFRFYDPRVLRVYLPTCMEEELRSFFGPIQTFWTEGQVPEDMLEFRIQRGGLGRRVVPLDSRRASEPAQSPREGGTISFDTMERYNPLRLREAQLEAFRRLEVQKFKEWMLAHLHKFFPAQCEAMGETHLRETIQYGIRRAASHGIKSQRDVCKYVDLMVLFGRNFDTEPGSRWAGEILGNPGSPSAKVQALFQEAKAHLRQG